MNVSLQNIDKVNALLTIKMDKADYMENVEKALKKVRKDAQMPGFRKGMVPLGIVKKLYGKSVMVDEVNKLLGETVNKYIQDNNLNILGEPLPNENQKQIDFDTMEEFEFLFDLAIAPEINVEATADDKVDYYDVTVTDEMVDNQANVYTQRNGKYEKVEAYAGDNDMMKGLLTELDADGNAKEGGVVVENAVMMPTYIKNEAQKKLFDGAKNADVITFNPSEAWEGNTTEISSLLKIDKAAAENMKSNFSYRVDEITHFVPGELNQEIFDEVFGEGTVKSVDEFKSKIKEVISAQFAANSDFKFLIDARKMLTEKAGEVQFPEVMLKRIMKANNSDKDDKFIEDNFEGSLAELKWQLIRDILVKAADIKVDHDEIVEAAKGATRAQFAQYGMLNVPDNVLDSYAKDMLKKQETIESLANRVVDNKLAEALKGKVTLEHKSVLAEEFSKLVK